MGHIKLKYMLENIMSLKEKSDLNLNMENEIENVVFQIQDSFESKYNSHSKLSQGSNIYHFSSKVYI